MATAVETKTEVALVYDSAPEGRFRSDSIVKDADEGGPTNVNSVPQQNYGGFGVEERPPVDYSSFRAFLGSSWRRFKSLWTRRFTYALLVGLRCPNLLNVCGEFTHISSLGWPARFSVHHMHQCNHH